jgi:hypothetical protein
MPESAKRVIFDTKAPLPERKSERERTSSFYQRRLAEERSLAERVRQEQERTRPADECLQRRRISFIPLPIPQNDERRKPARLDRAPLLLSNDFIEKPTITNTVQALFNLKLLTVTSTLNSLPAALILPVEQVPEKPVLFLATVRTETVANDQKPSLDLTVSSMLDTSSPMHRTSFLQQFKVIHRLLIEHLEKIRAEASVRDRDYELAVRKLLRQVRENKMEELLTRNLNLERFIQLLASEAHNLPFLSQLLTN